MMHVYKGTTSLVIDACNDGSEANDDYSAIFYIRKHLTFLTYASRSRELVNLVLLSFNSRHVSTM